MIFLKKLGAIILLLFSLQLFGGEYEVKKSKKVTLSEQQINQENKEIEAGLKNIVKETYRLAFSSFSNILDFGFENEIDTKKMTKKEKEDLKKGIKMVVESYSKIFILVAETTEIKVKKIEYLSNSKVNVEYETKIVDIDGIDLNNDKDEKEIERRFLKKYGRKLPKDKVDNIEDISKMMDIYMEILKEKLENSKVSKKYKISKDEMELEKIKGKWTSRELEEYFPEEHKKENETFEITLLYEKDPVLSQIFQKITRLLDNYNKVSEYSNKIKDTTVFYNKIEAKNKKRTTSLKIDFKRTRNLKFREIPHPSIIESESLNVEYVK